MRLQNGVLLLGLTVCAVGIGGCSGEGDSFNASSGVNAAASSTLIGYGATPAVWNANHGKDSQTKSEDTVYLEGVKIDRGSVRYTDFFVGDGHVIHYAITFPKNTSLQTAYRYVMRSEFPGDARPGVLQVATRGRYPGTCAGFTVRSPTIRSVMKHGWTAVGVEFQSENFDHLDTSNVWFASIHFGAFEEC